MSPTLSLDLTLPFKNKSNMFFLFSLSLNAMNLVCVWILATTPGIINRIDPHSMNQFPNYLWVFLHHHITCQVVISLNAFIIFRKKEQLIQIYKRLYEEVLESVKKQFRLEENWRFLTEVFEMMYFPCLSWSWMRTFDYF